MEHSTGVAAQVVKNSSQSDKRLRRKTGKFCADKQTDKQEEDVVQSTILAKSIKHLT